MRRLLNSITSIVALTVLLTGTALADDKPAAAAQDGPSAEKIQKAFEAFAKPGKPHQQLKRLVGQWNTVSKSYPENPDLPAEGKATFRMIMGGRYIQQRFQGEYAGKKFTGMGISGYDNASKKYVGIWIDNMGTGILRTEGEYDVKTHKMVEIGTSSSPLGPMKMKMVSDYVSNDKFVFTMFMVTPAGEQKMMEIVYTRAASEK